MVLSFMEDNSRRQWRRSLETATMVESFVLGVFSRLPFVSHVLLTCSLLFRARCSAPEPWDPYVARTPMLSHLLLLPSCGFPSEKEKTRCTLRAAAACEDKREVGGDARGESIGHLASANGSAVLRPGKYECEYESRSRISGGFSESGSSRSQDIRAI
jgi:hypothetical protein